MNNGFNTTWQAMDSGKVIGGRVEDFSIEPNEKLTLEADNRALKKNEFQSHRLQKDKIDGMVQCNVQLDRNW